MARNQPPRRNAHLKLRARLSNVIVNVPDTDWARVVAGEKRVFRSYSRRGQPAMLPTPCVAYRFGPGDRLETAVLWLEDTWQEPLGSITPEQLAEEGFETLSDFRRYIEQRYPKGGYRPLAMVQVCRIRPLEPGDLEQAGAQLVAHMGYS